MLISIIPSEQAAELIKQEATIVFYEARQECLRFKIRPGDEGVKRRAIEKLNRLHLLHTECLFEPSEIGTNHRELTSLYQMLGYFLISTKICSFFHLREKRT